MKGICVLIVVLCVCLSLVSPTSGRRRTTKKPRPTTIGRRHTTTPRPTTITTLPRGACVVDGQIHYEGASISRDSENCYGRVCMGGSVTSWDDRCFLNGQPPCNGQLVDIPGQCCHECVATTAPPTTTPDGPTGVCIANGLTYMDGETIGVDPENCHGSVCMGGYVINWDDRCFLNGQPPCDGELVDITGQCCHECVVTPTHEPPTTIPNSTPLGPHGSCMINGHVYMDGEIIHADPENCHGRVCSFGNVASWDDVCFLMGQPDCNGHLMDIPGQCCHECIEVNTTTASASTNS